MGKSAIQRFERFDEGGKWAYERLGESGDSAKGIDGREKLRQG